MADKTPIQPSLMLYLENICLSTSELFVLGFKVKVANFEPRLTYFVGRLAEPVLRFTGIITGSFLGHFLDFSFALVTFTLSFSAMQTARETHV